MAKVDAVAVTVEWVDSCGLANGPWHRASDVRALRPSRMVTRGFLVVDRKRYIVVAGSLASSGHVAADVMAIPRGAILRLRCHKVAP